MKHVASFIDSISEWSGKIVSYLILVAMAIVVYEVITRYGLRSPTIWGLELTIFVCIAVYMVGGAFVHRYDNHIRVDALFHRFTPRVKAIVDLITSPVYFISLGILGWAGADWTIKGIVRGTTSGSFWDPIMWPVRLLIPLSCLLLLLQGVAKFIRDIEAAHTGETTADTSMTATGASRAD